MYKMLALALLLLPFLAKAQSGVYERISKEDFRQVTATDIFDYQPSSAAGDLKDVVGSYQLGTPGASLNEMLAQQPELLRLKVQVAEDGSIFILKLKRTHVLTPEFVHKGSVDRKVMGSTPETGLHYQGVVEGLETSSVVAISLFDKNVMGMISTRADGNYTIGRLRDQDLFIIYRDANLDAKVRESLRDVTCHTNTEGLEGGTEGNRPTGDENPKCVTVYMEVNHDIYNGLGGYNPALQFALGSFNETSVLYANESIDLKLREVLIWQTTSPYTGSTSTQQLYLFRDNAYGFTGNVGIMIDWLGQGGMGYVNTLCADKYNVCYAGVRSYYETVPTYSTTVHFMAHEIGHVIGSVHTHDCVWNGNGTGIDRCAPAYDPANFPDCTPPAPLPGFGGGTIMSYCHLPASSSVGFANGFGPQPGDVLRNRVGAAPCIQVCCPDVDLVMQFPVTTPGIYQAQNTVTGLNSNQVAVSSGTVHYRAGDYVALEAGFNTLISGSGVFIADIGPCVAVLDRDGKREAPSVAEAVQQLPDEFLRIFPNPVQNILQVESGADIVAIRILNTSGALAIRQQATGGKTASIDVRSLPSGIYFIEVTTGNKSVARYKVVKL